VPESDGTDLRPGEGAGSDPCVAAGGLGPLSGEASSLNYESSFGFGENPFSLAPDPRFFFNQSAHGAIFEALLAGIARRDGVLVVTGETGTGKTTLCRAVLQMLDRKMFTTLVDDPFLSREELLKTLLIDFGVISADNLRSGPLSNASRTALRYSLHDFFNSLQPLQASALVVIDDAHNLSADSLHEINLLSALEFRQKLLQFLLVGQPELQTRLGTSEMRHLTQRVLTQSELRPLAGKDLRPYVTHRLTIAGNGELRFTDAALALIYGASNGVPRTINVVCDAALSRAHRAGTSVVDVDHVIGAVGDLEPSAAGTMGAVSRDRPDMILLRGSGDAARGSLAGANPVAGRPQGVAGAAMRSALTLARAPVMDREEPHWEDSDKEWLEASVAMGQGADQPALASTGSSGAGDPVMPNFDPRPTSEPPSGEREETSAQRLERLLKLFPEGENPAPVTAPPVSDQVASTGGQPSVSADNAPSAMFDEDAGGLSSLRLGVRVFLIALLVITAAIVAYQFWLSPGEPEQPDAAAIAKSEPVVPAQPPAAVPPADAAVSTAGNSKIDKPSNRVPSRPVAFAVKLGTFQIAENATRAVQGLQNAGYRAYSGRVTLPSGRSAVGVFLGPYAERAEAERDRERAARIPDYGSGQVIRVDPNASVKPPS
jgi:general secretion pathway protein A